MQGNYFIIPAAVTMFVVLLVSGCSAGGSGAASTRTANTESRPQPKCLAGEVLMCQTGKTGFGRLSTGRNTNYDHCSCEPSSVVIQDTRLPQ